MKQPSDDKHAPRVANQTKALILPLAPMPLRLGEAIHSVPPGKPHEHFTFFNIW